MTYLHPLALTHLDALWGLAALPLFWSHVRGLFFVPYENVLNRNVLVKAFYFYLRRVHTVSRCRSLWILSLL